MYSSFWHIPSSYPWPYTLATHYDFCAWPHRLGCPAIWGLSCSRDVARMLMCCKCKAKSEWQTFFSFFFRLQLPAKAQLRLHYKPPTLDCCQTQYTICVLRIVLSLMVLQSIAVIVWLIAVLLYAGLGPASFLPWKLEVNDSPATSQELHEPFWLFPMTSRDFMAYSTCCFCSHTAYSILKYW